MKTAARTAARRGAARPLLAARMLALVLAGACAAAGAAQTADAFGERWALLVAGVSGSPELRQQYLGEIRELRNVLVDSLGFSAERVIALFEDPALAPALVRYRSTREGLEHACGEIAGRAASSDLVFAFFLGHGSFDGRTYKLNLVGPDPTAEELAATLYAIPAACFVVVNATSASGGSVAALARDRAVVVAATRSGNERNQTHLAAYLIEALRDRNADLDKNGRISVLEAFTYAARKVEDYYAKEGLLQTEHPVLDDDGDGVARTDPGPANGEGMLARTTYFDAAAGRTAQSAEERALAREAEALEAEIEKLKYAKAGMPQEEYGRKLETLLLRLAEIHAKLRKK